MKTTPEELLERVLEILDRELDAIGVLAKFNKLSTETSKDLTGYAQLLLKIQEGGNEAFEAKRRTLSKLTTEELKARLNSLTRNPDIKSAGS